MGDDLFDEDDGLKDELPPTRIDERYEEATETPNSKLFRISKVDVMAQPDSYRNNTQKEELMLECAPIPASPDAPSPAFCVSLLFDPTEATPRLRCNRHPQLCPSF